MMDTWGLLGQALECSVCLEQLDTSSRVLPCQHTFCRNCLIDIINSHKELRCPECRVLVTVPFDSLPPNILLMRILEGFKKFPQASSEDSKTSPKSKIPIVDPNISKIMSPNILSSDQLTLFPHVLQSNFTCQNLISSVIANAQANSDEVSVSQNSSAIPLYPSTSNSNTLVPNVSCERRSLNQANVSYAQANHLNCNHQLIPKPSVCSVINPFSNASEPAQTGQSESLLQAHVAIIDRDKPPVTTNAQVASNLNLFANQIHFPNQFQDTTTTCTRPSLSFGQPFASSTVFQNFPSFPTTQVNPKNESLSVLSPVTNVQNSSSYISAVSHPHPSIGESTFPILYNTKESVLESHTNLENNSNCCSLLNSKEQRKENTAVAIQAGTSPLHTNAKAIYSFEAKETRDLTFKKGDIITIWKQIDENWYYGKLNGQIGFIPSSYIQLVEPMSSHIPQCKALYDFKMTSEEEKNCLTFVKGEIITVLRRIDDNWAEGKLNSHIGIFPLSFVELNNAAKTLVQLSASVQPSRLRVLSTSSSSVSDHQCPMQSVSPTVELSKERRGGDILATNSSPVFLSTLSMASSPSNTTCSSLPLTPTVVKNVSGLMDAPQVNDSNKRHSFTDFQPQTNLLTGSPHVINRFSLEVSTPQRKTLSTVISSKSNSSSEKVQTDSNSSSSQFNVDSRERSFTLSNLKNLQLYIALYSYHPRKADELELKKGQLYSVSEKCQDGWFKGQCLSTDKIGVFPGNYIQIAKSQTVSAYLSRYSALSCSNQTEKNFGSLPSSKQMSSMAKASLNHGLIDSGSTLLAPSTSSFDATNIRDSGGNICSLPTVPPELPPRSSTLEKHHLFSTNTSSLERTTWQHPKTSTPDDVNHGHNASTVSFAEKKSGQDRSSANGGIALMKKLTSAKRKGKSPPRFTTDNPIFEGTHQNLTTTSANAHSEPRSISMDGTPKHTKQPAPLVRERYRCIVPYPPNSMYELELQLGDLIYVHKKREDGWYKGTLQRTGKTGLFPASFVEIC